MQIEIRNRCCLILLKLRFKIYSSEPPPPHTHTLMFRTPNIFTCAFQTPIDQTSNISRQKYEKKFLLCFLTTK